MARRFGNDISQAAGGLARRGWGRVPVTGGWRWQVAKTPEALAVYGRGDGGAGAVFLRSHYRLYAQMKLLFRRDARRRLVLWRVDPARAEALGPIAATGMGAELE